jgi:hypothetical protein
LSVFREALLSHSSLPANQWQVGNAADWFEKRLGIRAGSIVFVRGGQPMKRIETVGSLRPKIKVNKQHRKTKGPS